VRFINSKQTGYYNLTKGLTLSQHKPVYFVCKNG